MKKLITILCTICLFSFNTTTFASDNEQACTAIMCLSGGWANATGFQECAPSLQAFGNIKIYSHEGFEGELTRAARAVFLESCGSADKTFLRQSLMLYGDREYIDINL